MKIEYDETEDILFLSLQEAPVVSHVSQGWNVNVGYSERGVAELSILDASKVGLWPVLRAGTSQPMGRSWRPWQVYVVLLGVVVAALAIMLVPSWTRLVDAQVVLTPRGCALLERAGAATEPIDVDQGCTLRARYAGSGPTSSVLRFRHDGGEVEVRINPSEVLSVRNL